MKPVFCRDFWKKISFVWLHNFIDWPQQSHLNKGIAEAQIYKGHSIWMYTRDPGEFRNWNMGRGLRKNLNVGVPCIHLNGIALTSDGQLFCTWQSITIMVPKSMPWKFLSFFFFFFFFESISRIAFYNRISTLHSKISSKSVIWSHYHLLVINCILHPLIPHSQFGHWTYWVFFLSSIFALSEVRRKECTTLSTDSCFVLKTLF